MNDLDHLEVLEMAKSIQSQAREQHLIKDTTSYREQNKNFEQETKLIDEILLFDTLITDTDLRNTARQLFIDGHYALSVEEAFKHLNNLVKTRSGLTADGSGLMRTAFSINNPILRINKLKTQSQKDQQQGYMDIFAGCMTGIRNPRAHEHQYLDDARVALEMLMLANHLMRLVNMSKRSRRSKK